MRRPSLTLDEQFGDHHKLAQMPEETDSTRCTTVRTGSIAGGAEVRIAATRRIDGPMIVNLAFDRKQCEPSEEGDSAQAELRANVYDGNNSAGVFCSSPVFEDALNAITEDIRSHPGHILLTGETGTGKTLLIRHVIDRLDTDVTPILLIDPRFSFQEFARFACRQLGLGPAEPGGDTSPEDLIGALREYLIAQRREKRSVAVFIDEAQEMSEALLEELLLLSDSAAAEGELLQIILVGLPSLQESQRKPALRELARRGLRLHSLPALKQDQITAFIRQRLDGILRRERGRCSRPRQSRRSQAIRAAFHGRSTRSAVSPCLPLSSSSAARSPGNSSTTSASASCWHRPGSHPAAQTARRSLRLPATALKRRPSNRQPTIADFGAHSLRLARSRELRE